MSMPPFLDRSHTIAMLVPTVPPPDGGRTLVRDLPKKFGG